MRRGEGWVETALVTSYRSPSFRFMSCYARVGNAFFSFVFMIGAYKRGAFSALKRVGNLSERKSKKLIQLWSNFFLQTFVGNKDAESVVINQVEPSFEAVCVRLHPQSWHRWISMRVELFGCPGNKNYSTSYIFQSSVSFHSC